MHSQIERCNPALAASASGLVPERERSAMSGTVLRQTLHVPARLQLDALKGPPFGLGLDHAYGLAVCIQKVVGLPCPAHGELANGYAPRGRDVHLAAVLD